MNRQEALKFLTENLSNQNLIKHCLAVEAVMRALARHFGQDEEKWGTAGLLHDIDYEQTKTDPRNHSLVGAKMLSDAGLEEDICQAVKAHNEMHGIAPESLMDKSLFVTDPLTGLIVASALVLPSKSLSELTPENIANRFGEKSFAKGANREVIKRCDELLGLEQEEFFKIALEAMQEIHGDLGL